MTEQQTQAMKLALEALEWVNRVNAMDYEYKQKARESLNAIYETLEQPAQDMPKIGCVNHDCDACKAREWVGLTDEQLESIWAEFGLVMQPTRKAIARAIEAKLKEKNCAQA